MSPYLHNHLRDLFKNWTTVSSYQQDGVLHVHLTLSNDALALKQESKGLLLDQLFGGGDARSVLRLAEKRQKLNVGLKAYGKKR